MSIPKALTGEIILKKNNLTSSPQLPYPLIQNTHIEVLKTESRERHILL